MAPGHPIQTFSPTEPYEVSREKIAEFADAIGDPNPLFRDPDAARAAGYPDVVAPPTFAIVIHLAARAQVSATRIEAFGRIRILHLEQRYEYSRPLYAGDVVTCRFTVSRIGRTKDGMLVRTCTEIKAANGEHIATAYSSIVEQAMRDA